MPIRFRCEKCNSKLSIATAKVGTSAECPSCHESLIVPAESTLPPKAAKGAPPRPSKEATGTSEETTRKVDEKTTKDAAESGLPAFPGEVETKAVQKKDAGSTERSEEQQAEQDNDSGADSGADSGGSQSKEPFDSPTSVRIETGSQPVVDSGETSDLAGSGSQSEQSSHPFDEFAVYDEPILIVDQDQPRAAPENVRIDHDRLAVPRRVIYMQGALLGLASLLFFSLGWWFGSSGASNSRAEANALCEVTGDIYYESTAGRKLDEGAVVIFLPTDRRPQTRPDAEQLMPGNVLTSRNESVQIIRGLGGDVGSVSSDGKFSIRLTANQSYYMCVLSANKSRSSDDEDLSKQKRAEIGTFFLPVESLVSKQEYYWETVSVTGKRRSIRDVVF